MAGSEKVISPKATIYNALGGTQTNKGQKKDRVNKNLVRTNKIERRLITYMKSIHANCITLRGGVLYFESRIIKSLWQFVAWMLISAIVGAIPFFLLWANALGWRFS